MSNEELNKRVYVREIKEFLNLEQICGDDSSLDRWVIAPDINRPGLELSGYLESNDLRRVNILGNKEFDYMSGMSYEEQRRRFDVITDSYTPCIILSEDFGDCPALMEVCCQKNFPVFRYVGKTYQLIVDVVSYLSEKLAPTDNLYGVMMSIYGVGVMIVGKSGIGKSELALDLIAHGHMLVADDRVDVARVHTSLITQAPSLLKRKLEVRGLGVVDVTRMFGAYAYKNRCNLDFVIKLVSFEEAKEIDRLNPLNGHMDILGLEKPMLTIPITEGKALSIIIESIVSNYLLKKLGYDSNETFKEEYRQELIRRSNEQ